MYASRGAGPTGSAPLSRPRARPSARERAELRVLHSCAASKGGTMFRSSGRRARRPLLILVSLAIACSALAITTAPVGAQSGGKGGKVDKAAILRFGVPIEENGGVYFDPATITITG